MPTKTERDADIEKVAADIEGKLARITIEITRSLAAAGDLKSLGKIQERLVNLIEVYWPKAKAVNDE